MTQSTLADYEPIGTDSRTLRDDIRLAVGMRRHDDGGRLRKFELLAALEATGERPHHETPVVRLRVLLADAVGIEREAYEGGLPFRRAELLALRRALG